MVELNNSRIKLYVVHESLTHNLHVAFAGSFPPFPSFSSVYVEAMSSVKIVGTVNNVSQQRSVVIDF
jgi:hypothetical protein